MSVPFPRFTEADSDRAYDEWGANCGPTAFAAILGLTLDETRRFFDAAGFPGKHYTNPTMMLEVLRASGRGHVVMQGSRLTADPWPTWGLVRIQWHGPWMEPGVPMAARYRHTHWVGSARRSLDPTMKTEVGIYDCNAMANGTGWVSIEGWRDIVVPFVTKEVKRADGKWSVTHAIEVRR
jgi:hypothetical protein